MTFVPGGAEGQSGWGVDLSDRQPRAASTPGLFAHERDEDFAPSYHARGAVQLAWRSMHGERSVSSEAGVEAWGERAHVLIN